MQQKWNRRVVTKYVLLQIPTTLLVIGGAIYFVNKLGLPWWLFWCVVLGTVVKDIALFPFVWRSYDSRVDHPMVGATGEAVERLSPEGYVRIQGVLWQARLLEGHEPIEEGESVSVERIEGIRLTITSRKKLEE